MSSQTPVIVGIAGGTASGKTTLARRVLSTLGGDECLLISHDRYYHDVENPRTFNYDHPDALQTSLLVDHLIELKAGNDAELPDYDFTTHTRRERGVATPWRPTILVEGILALESADLRELYDLMVYVETPDDLRLARRIRRDATERGRDVEEVLTRWLTTVRPMHMRFVQPTRTFADLELTGTGLLEPLVDSLLSAIDQRRRELGEDDGDPETLEELELVIVEETTEEL
jgi:uridine kinase